jgi:hypothetical protein
LLSLFAAGSISAAVADAAVDVLSPEEVDSDPPQADKKASPDIIIIGINFLKVFVFIVILFGCIISFLKFLFHAVLLTVKLQLSYSCQDDASYSKI